MAKVIDMTGKTFGRWRVIARSAKRTGHKAHWLCRCSCGTEGAVTSYDLRRGHSKSCGCLNLDSLAQRSTTHGHTAMARISSTYSTWMGMRARCMNPNKSNYAYYGGRGIRVCERWMTFANFAADMGEKQPGMFLDRIDNNGDYCPENCRWTTRREQMRNMRTNRFITFDGLTMLAVDWAAHTGIPKTAIRRRLQRGWSVERTLTTPVSRLRHPQYREG